MITLDVDPRLRRLAAAIGLLNDDGHVDASWFENPLPALRRMVSDPGQRAALFDLVGTLLPEAAAPRSAGSGRRHPLLNPSWLGNVYVTLDGNRIGVAAELATPPDTQPRASATVSLPLVEADEAGLRVLAGSSDGPLEIVLEAAWGDEAAAQRVRVMLAIDLAGGASVRLALDNVDLGHGVLPSVTLDAAQLDEAAVTVISALLREVLVALAGGGAEAQRVAGFLPVLLGLHQGGNPLPLTSLGDGGEALRTWLSELAADPVDLKDTFDALLGLLGGTPSGGGPGPLRGTVLTLGNDATLGLYLSVSSDAPGTATALDLGVSLDLHASAAVLQARATLVRIPLTSTAPVTALPKAAVSLSAPGTSGALLPPGPVRLGGLEGGLRWDGTRVVPLLELTDLDLDGTTYARLDLTDAAAVEAAANTAVAGQLRAALGNTDLAAPLLTLLGFEPPSGDLSSTHRTALVDLVTSPTAALAAFHRSVLASSIHPWSHVLEDIGALLGVKDTAVGEGTAESPWTIGLAAADPLKLRLAAWHDVPAGAGATPGRLRLGLVIDGARGGVTVEWRCTLLDIDLIGGSGISAFSGHRLNVLSPALSATTSTGLAWELAHLSATAQWQAGHTVQMRVAVDDFSVTADGQTVGPLTVPLPLPLRTNPDAPDLGLGITPADTVTLARLVLGDALSGWGGPGGPVVGALLGLHRRLPGLPADWPLLGPPDPDDLRTIGADPLSLVAAHARRLLTGIGADGTPYVVTALPYVADLLGFDRAPVARPELLVQGGGSRDNPWVLPVTLDGPELLLWLDPAGPSGGAPVRDVATALDGTELLSRLARLPGMPSLAAVGRDSAVTGPALDALGAWLTAGDGLVPLASQVAVPAAWTQGATVTSSHLDQPGDPEVIAQVVSALDGWAQGAPRAVVLLGPAFTGAGTWAPLLDVVEPGRPPEAAFNLRSSGADAASVDAVTAVAQHYPVELADRDATVTDLVAQLSLVVDRIRQLTGRTKVFLVAHSTAGVTARTYAEASPDRVAGIVTVGTPFGGTPLTPLTDPAVADAVRLASRLAGTEPDNQLLRTTRSLARALDGEVDTPAGPVRVPFPRSALPAAPTAAGAVPGHVVPAALSGGIVEALATALAINDATDPAPAPQFCGYGVRLPFDLPTSTPGEIAVTARLRVDLGAFGLELGPVTPPGRRILLEVTLDRPGGWLLGAADSTGVRLRRADLGVSLTGGPGGTVVTPALLLHEAGAEGATSDLRDLDDLLASFGGLPDRLPLTSAPPAADTPDALLADLLTAVGLLVSDGAGGLALALDELVAVAAQPADRLGPHLPEVLDLIGARVGLQGPAGGPWRLTGAGWPVELTLSAGPWTVAVDSIAETPLTVGPVAVTGAVRLTLPTLEPTAALQLRTGGARLDVSTPGPAAVLTVAGTALPLLPVPAGATVAVEAVPLLARATPAAAVSAVLGGILGTPVRGVDALLTDPGAWLLRPEVLGDGDGRPDPAKVAAAVRDLATVLGVPEQADVPLPGGLRLTFPPGDLVALGGTLNVAGATADLDLSLSLDGRGVPAPHGALVLQAPVPGSWGSVSVRFEAGPAGFVLRVTPGTGTPIDLLPRFGGFGQLAGNAAPLLATGLQAIVDAIAPHPAAPPPLLDTVLRLAKVLGWYDFDADGFARPARAAELAKGLTPGWLEAKATSAGTLADAVLAVASQLSLPLGALARDGDTVVWSFAPVTGATVSAGVGFTNGFPTVSLGLSELPLGPVRVQEVTLAHDGSLRCTVVVALDAGGQLAWFRPALSLGVDAGGLTVRFDPLGTASAADLSLVLAPTFAAVITEAGALELVGSWGVPLAAQLLLGVFEDRLGPLWAGGPTARAVLDDAGVTVAGTNPPAMEGALPPPAELGLRVLAALMSDLEFPLGDGLAISVVSEGGRHGMRLSGALDLGGDEVAVELRFGAAEWLPGAVGATVWLLEDVVGAVPVQLTPALDLDGLGVALTGAAGPLVEGPLTVGGIAALLFARVDLLQGRAVQVQVSELGAAVEVRDAHVSVSAEDADSFLKNVLPPNLAAPFDVSIAYRDGIGLEVHGGLQGEGLSLAFPLDLDLLLLRVTELFLALEASSAGARAQLALSGRADLGVLRASVARVGLQARFGPAGAALSFRAPDGVGLVLDAGVVSGGGFLYIDEPKGQYAGGLQLQLECLSLTAIGLLNTKMPDGSPIPGIAGLPGFSLLIIITAELPPIQLGFGFTLNGIGGILGLNRTMHLPALRAGVRTRALDTMLFPQDPAGNAATVVRTLSTVFPVAPHRFVVGPMVRLGWGTPTMLQIDLGVLIELPAPVRVALLGRIRVGIPQADESAIVTIRLDAVGAIDFGTGEISVDAIIYDSHIAGFALTGGMALRARFRNDPAFALAVGGFHPAFTPPPDFPAVERIALELASGNNPRLRLETYLAVTSNTIQLGASVDLHAEAAGAAIDGHLSFDALLQLAPFGIDVEIKGSVAVTYQGSNICSVAVRVNLTGPGPWRVSGEATVKVLVLSATVRFDTAIGEGSPPPLPPAVNVGARMLSAVADPANWSAQPPSTVGIVSLRGGQAPGAPLAHPLGSLTFSQQIAPLGLTISRFGPAPVHGADRFEVAAVSCNGIDVPAEDRREVTAFFAPAQFLDLPEDQQLSRPSYEPHPSGVTLLFDGLEVDELAATEAATFDYELIVVDDADNGQSPSRAIVTPAAAVAATVTGAAATEAADKTGPRRFRTAGARVELRARSFAAVDPVEGITRLMSTAMSFSSAAEAVDVARRAGRAAAILPVTAADVRADARSDDAGEP